MYDVYFGLSEPPFENNLDQRFFFLSENHKEVLAALLYFVSEDKGFALVCGDVGTGKTMLINSFLDKLPASVKPIVISNPDATYLSILRYIGRKLAVSDGQDSVLELFDEVKDTLNKARQQGRKSVLIIDEAHLLSNEALEGIRLLSNIETREQKLLQILLVGQYELSHKLDRVEMRQLRERININRFLSPMDQSETTCYVDHRLKVTGGSFDSCFEPQCKKLIYAMTQGVPRRINLLCDHALLVCESAQVRKVNKSILKRAQDALRSDRIFAPKAVDTPKRSLWQTMKSVFMIGSYLIVLVLVGILVYGGSLDSSIKRIMAEIYSTGVLSEKKPHNNPSSPMAPDVGEVGNSAEHSSAQAEAPFSADTGEELNPLQPQSKGTEAGQISASKEPLSDPAESTKNEHKPPVNAEGNGVRNIEVSVMRHKIRERDVDPSPSEKPASESNPSITSENPDRNDALIYADQSAQGYSGIHRTASILPSSPDNQELIGKNESSERKSALDTEKSRVSGESEGDKPKPEVQAVTQNHELSHDAEMVRAEPSVETSSPDAGRSASVLSADRQRALSMPETQKNGDPSIGADSAEQRTYQEAGGELASLNLGSRDNSRSGILIKPESGLTSSKTMQKRNLRRVKKGDTLMEFASELSPDNPEDALKTILRLNPSITDMNRIYPGQIIVLSTSNAADQSAQSVPEDLHYSRYGTYESWQDLEQVMALLAKLNIKYLIVNTPSSVGGSVHEVIIGGYETADALKAALGRLNN